MGINEQKKYIVVDEPRGTLSGDMWTDVYNSPSEATEAAEIAWNHLTAAEQRERHIFAAVVDETGLAADAVDEDGNIDWRCWNSADTYDGAFDSYRVEQEEEEEDEE